MARPAVLAKLKSNRNERAGSAADDFGDGIRIRDTSPSGGQVCDGVARPMRARAKSKRKAKRA
jgi:hypothetical protein